MKNFAKILLGIVFIILGIIIYYVVDYFYLSDFAMEKKILASIVFLLVGIPIFGRFLHVLKDK